MNNSHTKSIVRSIKPYWVYLICEGKKTIEVGKDQPKNMKWNETIFIYCSKDIKSFNRIPDEYKEKYRSLMGKVVAEFVCENIQEFTTDYRGNRALNEYIGKAACLSFEEMEDYENSSSYPCLYAWYISKLKVYKNAKDLNELGIKRPPQSWCYCKK